MAKNKVAKMEIGDERIQFAGEIFFIKAGVYTAEQFGEMFGEKLKAHGVDGFALFNHIHADGKFVPVDSSGKQKESVGPQNRVTVTVESPKAKAEAEAAVEKE
jgi:hypothetical protein